MLVDNFGRIHDYLRISLTDRCNYQCLYCLPEPEFNHGCSTVASDRMTAQEIVEIATKFVSLGVNKIRLTGGEPLIRKDAGDIMLALGRLPVKLTLTTNGSRLDHFIDIMHEAGVKSVNVSLDSLRKENFHRLTLRDDFEKVKSNIDLLLTKGFDVKVNMVVMNGYNDHEVVDFASWTVAKPVHIRYIEFMPFPGNRWRPEKLINLQQIVDMIELAFGSLEKLEDGPHDTTRKFRIPGSKGTIAIISTMSAPFCDGCNRLRLTADGKMRNCLFSKTETDLLNAFRNGHDIEALIKDCLAGKHRQLGGNSGTEWGLQETEEQRRTMMGIGG
ncbi:MAG: GTP 3',8-cyclase MoaA [Bacteroidota bacterium]|jgi:cyclic pyranopterin phosphate synthase